jgi:hypothetical protein
MDEEPTGSCLAGDRCRARDEYGPAETRDPLCFHCLESAERDVRALVLDYRDLEQHLVPSLGQRGSGLPTGRGGLPPLPIAEHVLDLQMDIFWLVDAWDAVVRDMDRLSDKPTRTRAGWAVQQSVSILAPRLDRLAQTSGTMWDYPGSTDRCSEVPGWQGVLDLARLHHRARHVLGLSADRGEACIGVICGYCDVKSKLVRDAEDGGVTCRACGGRYTAVEYTLLVGVLFDEATREEAA